MTATPVGAGDILLIPSIRAHKTSFAYVGFLRHQNGSMWAFPVGVKMISHVFTNPCSGWQSWGHQEETG